MRLSPGRALSRLFTASFQAFSQLTFYRIAVIYLGLCLGFHAIFLGSGQHIRGNYLNLFPKLLDQSQFNRRARGLRTKVEEFRQRLVQELITPTPESILDLLLDTKPIPVVGYKRNKNGSDFLNSAGYGVCASRKMQYFGYKLVALTTFEGLPLVYDLVPANTDERAAAETVLIQAAGVDIFGDKGFIGEFWQQSYLDA